MEGSVRNTGVHASAIIIGPDTLTNFIPLSTTKDKETGEDILVSQFEGSLIEQVGMLKMDFLGLKTLSILKSTVENVRANHNISIDINALPLTDGPTSQAVQPVKPWVCSSLKATVCVNGSAGAQTHLH